MERVVQGFENLATLAIHNYNIKTFEKIIKTIELAVQQGDENVSTNLKNYVDTLNAQVATKLKDLDEQIKEVRSLAQILTDAEKGQLEEILNNVLKTIAQEGLLNRLCVTLPTGENVSLADLFNKVATIPQVKKIFYTYDQSTGELVSVKAVLTDGYKDREEIFNFDKTPIKDDKGNVIGYMITYSNNPQDGYYKLVGYFKYSVKQIEVFKQTFEWCDELLEEGRPVVDLQFEACPYNDTVEEAIDKASDINQDGQVGDTTTAELGGTTSDQTNSGESSTTTTESSDGTTTGSDI
jgi:hypothetical protein